MKPELQALLELQDIDLALDRLQRRKQEIPQEIQQKKARIETLQREKAQLVEHLNQKKLQIRKLEKEILAAEETLQKFQSDLLKLKDNKEYQAKLHEIEIQKQKIRQLEDQTLEVMEEVEILEQELPAKQRELERQIQEIQARVAALEKEFQGLDDQMLELSSRREAYRTRVPASLLKQYDRLRHLVGGRVVVPVQNNTCTGCNAELPVQVVINLKVTGEFGHCENCGRFIYVED